MTALILKMKNELSFSPPPPPHLIFPSKAHDFRAYFTLSWTFST